MRYLLALAYPLLPALYMGSIPDPKLAPIMAGLVFTSGVLVAWVHLRQTTGKGQLKVFFGTLLGIGVGVSAWAMGMLFLAFASDSGKYATEIGWMMLVFTVLMTLVPAPLLAYLVAKPRR